MPAKLLGLHPKNLRGKTRIHIASPACGLYQTLALAGAGIDRA
jgi:hypothetical protein